MLGALLSGDEIDVSKQVGDFALEAVGIMIFGADSGVNADLGGFIGTNEIVRFALIPVEGDDVLALVLGGINNVADNCGSGRKLAGSSAIEEAVANRITSHMIAL